MADSQGGRARGRSLYGKLQVDSLSVGTQMSDEEIRIFFLRLRVKSREVVSLVLVCFKVNLEPVIKTDSFHFFKKKSQNSLKISGGTYQVHQSPLFKKDFRIYFYFFKHVCMYAHVCVRACMCICVCVFVCVRAHTRDKVHMDMDEGAHGGQNRELGPLKLDFFLAGVSFREPNLFALQEQRAPLPPAPSL